MIHQLRPEGKRRDRKRQAKAEQIVDAIRSGRTLVTDGPFLEIGVDADGDGYGQSCARGSNHA